MFTCKHFDGRGELWEGWIERFLEYGWERKHLPAGDFWFPAHGGKTVGIETKTVKDITSRLGDARRELAQLLDSVDIPILMIFGKWARKSNDIILGGQDQLTWGHLWNMLQTFQQEGLLMEICLSRDHAFLRINQLFAYYQKPEHLSSTVARRSVGDRRIASLMAIPGISRKLAHGLLKSRGSIRNIANTPKDELELIPLIGPSRANLIEDFLSREGPYP